MTQERRKIVLGSEQHRRFVGSLVATSPPQSVVTIEPPRRTINQNDAFHALCGDIADAFPEWNGIHMDADDWKALLIVSHAVATGEPGGMRMVPDLEGHGFVQLRESSARMSKARGSSLIEYATAWAVSHNVPIKGEA